MPYSPRCWRKVLKGCIPLVKERLKNGGSLDGLADQFEAVAIRQMAKAVYAGAGSELTKYRGSKLDELRKLLAEQDSEIIELSRRQLRTKLRRICSASTGQWDGRKSTWTELALIENEISKKQRYISVRDLTQRAGRALLELKPCWMMSPLAVAQYVPKGSIHFDLCIIDEASQMPPEVGDRRATPMRSDGRRRGYEPASAKQLLQDAH